MKQPEGLTHCEKCGQRYGFIACRVSRNDGTNWCLHCCVEEEKAKKQLSTPPRIDKSTGPRILTDV